KYRVGVVFGTGVGGIITFEQQVRDLAAKGTRAVSPIFIPKMISNIAPGQIAMRYQCTGDNFTVASACSSGTHAIGEGFRKIKDGYLDACICGGSEACITPVAIAGFANMTALATTTDPALASLPFDKKRNGFVLAEGSGMLILEELEQALARGAEIYGEIVGYGATSDAYHITSPSPDGQGAAKAMMLAMEEAGIEASEVDYINAHGTGTPVNDPFETTAIKLALGEERAHQIPVNSSKSMTGHLLGAAGSFEAIVTALSIREGIVHRTVGLTDPDPECDLDYVAEGNRRVAIRYALTNSLGFGGHNGTLCLAKYEG
ncbi:MAG TPA: beta-ketoacyl-ACP synthase II, partial [Clostridiaceae bacterium]|nr:beta-ketoacyl-ACP synthase II [Clostridiaceae bacterium]